MPPDPVWRLLGAPEVPEPAQGRDTYPRVIRQEPHGDRYMLVTFALPGLRRQRMLVPLEHWVAGDHLDCHDATVKLLSRLCPPHGK